MNREEINYIINQYFDGELDKNKEIVLFSQLSQNETAREYFKSMHLLRTGVEQSTEKFPAELEKRILYSLDDNNQKSVFTFSKKNIFSFASYAAAAVFLIFALLFYTSYKDSKTELDTAIQQVQQQNKMIELLYNSLPAANVYGSYQNPVIVKAN